MKREAEALTYFEAQQRGSVRLIRVLTRARNLVPLRGIADYFPDDGTSAVHRRAGEFGRRQYWTSRIGPVGLGRVPRQRWQLPAHPAPWATDCAGSVPGNLRIAGISEG